VRVRIGAGSCGEKAVEERQGKHCEDEQNTANLVPGSTLHGYIGFLCAS
jgi:hypothetical protein